MAERENIFLSVPEAREAVCFDFCRYEPQTLLFCEVMRVISNGDVVLERERGRKGVWIGDGHSQKMNWLDGKNLGAYVCNALNRFKPDQNTTAAVCARVFQTRAFPSVDQESGTKGVRIETGMEAFSCRQCGNCCRSLDYYDALETEDFKRWEKTGRGDILERVGVFEKGEQNTVYRIWIEPGTTDLVAQCPFLAQVRGQNRWICQIHDTKPSICRNYPVSRKHGTMTGCLGFSHKFGYL